MFDYMGKLEKRDVYVNVSTVLKTGDGSGLVNVTTTTEICCPGFYTKKKGRCKKCPKGTYGPECLNICYCTVYKKCDRRTGECKKCKEKPCEDDEGGDDNYYKSTVSTKDYSKTPRPQLLRKRYAPSTATEFDHGIKYNITTVHPCDICEQFGSCSNEPGCVLSAGHGSGSSHKTDNWTIISIVLSISVIGNVIAFVLGFIRYQRRRQRNLSQTAPVIKLTNDVNNGGENIMAESSHEYLQMTDDCHSYNALNNNRAYVSMYNELNVTHEYTDAFTPNGNDRQNMHSDMVIETARHSVANDYETVE
ncbi:uncharacterized protein LOC143075299 isoform X2 [Mytilus galloprovincialis]|uniref:uncharacterized protein LOC143075299 isoform X2 n=1 Tax=Mytilus galloprovincialis TaxID=29158 RepID=UPI003F7CB188